MNDLKNRTSLLHHIDLKSQASLAKCSLVYGVASPFVCAQQLGKLNPAIMNKPRVQLFRSCVMTAPAQIGLKYFQLNFCSLFSELNPFVSFYFVGVLQGALYGQANIFIYNSLRITKTLSYANVFRGHFYAGLRDVISQGVPFVVVKDVKCEYKYLTLVSSSIVCTGLSQTFNNLQMYMQVSPKSSHYSAISELYKCHGNAMFYKGFGYRVSFLLFMNTLNTVFLSDIW